MCRIYRKFEILLQFDLQFFLYLFTGILPYKWRNLFILFKYLKTKNIDKITFKMSVCITSLRFLHFYRIEIWERKL